MYKNLFTQCLFFAMLCTVTIFTTQSLTAQCTNTTQYPSNSVTADNGGGVVTINTCNYLEEYSVITGLAAGNDYEFTVSGYITVYQDGALLGHGDSPVTVTAASAGDIEVHWNVDAACATASACVETTVQCTNCSALPLPACSANEMAVSTDPTCGFAPWTLSWDAAADATSYKVSVGSAPGLTDLVAPTDVGSVLMINLNVGLSTDYYWMVVPTNSTGDATGCAEQMFTTGPQGTCYCVSSYSNTSDDWISNVKLGTIDNASASVGYEDYTAVSTDLEVGGSYTMEVSVGMPTGYDQYVSVYIDWNQDYIFDEAPVELGFCNAGGGCMVTGTIEVPANAPLGSTTMRVIENYNAVAGDPCINAQYGETEDYSINVVAAAAACDTPVNIAHSLVGPARCDITWDAVPGALRYDVHYRVSGSGPTGWVRSGALNNSKSLHFLAENTVYDYIVRATCDGTWDFATASAIRRFNTGNIPAAARQNMFVENVLNISPNPARESIQVDYAVSTVSDVNISIVDMMGKVIFNKQLSNVEGNQTETIDVSDLGQGYYMLVMQSGENKMVKKFATIR